MKKIVSAILFISIVLGTLFIPSFSVTDTAVVYSMENSEVRSAVKAPNDKIYLGDINGDRQFNIRDSFYLRLYILDYSIDCERFALDINGDESVNLRDSFALSLAILGKTEREVYNNYTAVSAYNEEEKTLELVTKEVGDGRAFFEIGIPYFDITDMKYCAIVLSGNASNTVSFADKRYILSECDNVEVIGEGEYKYLIFALPDNKVSMKLIEVVYSEAASTDDKILLDSVIFAKSREDAANAADGRLAQRNGAVESEHIGVVFSSDTVIETNNIACTASAEGLRLVSVGSENTYAAFSMEDMNISADENKFAVFTSMLEKTNTQVVPTGKITFVLDSGREYSMEYSLINDEIYHSVVVDFSEAENWTGNIVSIRINNLTAPSIGLASYIKDIKFCKSLWDARSLCIGVDENTLDSRLLYTYGFYEEGEYSMPYRYYIPFNYDAGKAYPLLTILHGASYRGNDNVRPIQAGFPLLLDSISDTARECIIFAPQCPEDSAWVDVEFSQAQYTVSLTPESRANKMMLRMLERLQLKFAVDSDRLYATGFSMGGYGVWDLLSRHGDIFAAGMPLCGGGDKSIAADLVDIPIWAFHGTNDTTVPVRGTRVMYNAIVKAGGTKITYTPLEGYEHNIWDTVYANEEYISWLFSQRLSDRTVQ